MGFKATANCPIPSTPITFPPAPSPPNKLLEGLTACIESSGFPDTPYPANLEQQWNIDTDCAEATFALDENFGISGMPTPAGKCRGDKLKITSDPVSI